MKRLTLAVLAILAAGCASAPAPISHPPEPARAPADLAGPPEKAVGAPCSAKCWLELRLTSPAGPLWVIEAPGWPGRRPGVMVGRAHGLDYYLAPLPSAPCGQGSTLCHYAAVLWRRCSARESPPCPPDPPSRVVRKLLGGARAGERIWSVKFTDTSPSVVDERVCPDGPRGCAEWTMFGDLR